jgi:hypothetical protein
MPSTPVSARADDDWLEFAASPFDLSFLSTHCTHTETHIMFDEMDRLRDEKELSGLLTHYAVLGAADRQVWQDRLLDREGVEARQLVRLYGELLAYGWLDQNTGLTPVLRRGEAPASYRITTAGLRALKQLRAEQTAAC